MLQGSQPSRFAKETLTAWGPAERSTRFYGKYVKRERQTHEESKYKVQTTFSHLLHPLSQGSGQPPIMQVCPSAAWPFRAGRFYYRALQGSCQILSTEEKTEGLTPSGFSFH